jgi:glycosyltransferase involved in cell wall biosynthesis
MGEAEEGRVSAVIPVHDSSSTLGAVLASVSAELMPCDEVILVDDRSRVPSDGIAAAYGMTLARSDRPPGAAGTRNSGAARASGDWILFIDSDAVPPQGWRRMLAEDFPRADAVQAIYSRRAPGRGPSTFYKNYYYHYTFTRRIRSPWVPGCGTFFFAIRRSLFEELGGFDERIQGATVEDADLAARLVGRGGRILMDRRIEVFHLREYTLRTLLRYDWRMMVAKTRYILRRDRRHGRITFSLGGVPEMSSVAAGSLAVWLVPAGLAASLIAPAGLFVAAAGAALLAATQAPFWAACIREGGGRGAAAAAVSIPDLLLILPAAAAGVLGSLLGRRY